MHALVSCRDTRTIEEQSQIPSKLNSIAPLIYQYIKKGSGLQKQLKEFCIGVHMVSTPPSTDNPFPPLVYLFSTPYFCRKVIFSYLEEYIIKLQFFYKQYLYKQHQTWKWFEILTAPGINRSYLKTCRVKSIIATKSIHY